MSCSPRSDTRMKTDAQSAQPAVSQEARLTARTWNSGFRFAHDTYNGMGAASDGRIYYVLSSERHDTAGQMYVFDPSTEKITHLGDLTEASGEKDKRVIAQGKSHVNFVESNGKPARCAQMTKARDMSGPNRREPIHD